MEINCVNFGENVEDGTESVGGWSADDSGIQKVIITEAYITQSAKGASAVNLTTKNKEGDERRYTIYFTNAKGEVFYMNKQSGKAVKLPGYQLLDNICLATCGKPFMEVYKAKQKKTIDLYDKESRREIPQTVPVLPLMCKKLVKLGIIKVISNGFKNGAATNDKRETNEIHMVFNAANDLTPKEAANGKTEPKLYNEWVKHWTGNAKDTYKPIEGVVGANMGDNPFSLPTDSVDLFGAESDATEPADGLPMTETHAAAPVAQEEEEDPFA
ncbi:MAG: single stranded DNA binding protein [Podoviridae sp. ctLUJ1]|nr:MAG: single stranded DNA binding protein [Podoviridae sp. ctLUJ1]